MSVKKPLDLSAGVAETAPALVAPVTESAPSAEFDLVAAANSANADAAEQAESNRLEAEKLAEDKASFEAEKLLFEAAKTQFTEAHPVLAPALEVPMPRAVKAVCDFNISMNGQLLIIKKNQLMTDAHVARFLIQNKMPVVGAEEGADFYYCTTCKAQNLIESK